jgi:hypothetical protein
MLVVWIFYPDNSNLAFGRWDVCVLRARVKLFPFLQLDGVFARPSSQFFQARTEVQWHIEQVGHLMALNGAGQLVKG